MDVRPENTMVVKVLSVVLFISCAGGIFFSPLFFIRFGLLAGFGSLIIDVVGLIAAYGIWKRKIWSPTAFLTFVVVWLTEAVVAQFVGQRGFPYSFLLPTLISALFLLMIFVLLRFYINRVAAHQVR